MKRTPSAPASALNLHSIRKRALRIHGSARAFADAAGCSASAISRVLSGQRVPQLPLQMKLARALGLRRLPTLPQVTIDVRNSAEE